MEVQQEEAQNSHLLLSHKLFLLTHSDVSDIDKLRLLDEVISSVQSDYGSGQINQAGVDHYNNLINELLANGIEPYVTIFHWDTPQALEEKYNGWLSPQIINDFGAYAETLFEKFGDRVKHWITINEAHTFAINGYDTGIAAPGRCSLFLHLFCRPGNSATEPYIVAHNLLLSHATAALIYREKYQAKQGGLIGAAFDAICMFLISSWPSINDVAPYVDNSQQISESEGVSSSLRTRNIILGVNSRFSLA